VDPNLDQFAVSQLMERCAQRRGIVADLSPSVLAKPAWTQLLATQLERLTI
jgi:hypothetical protein